MTFSGPVINQSACGIYLSHIIKRVSEPKRCTCMLIKRIMCFNTDSQNVLVVVCKLCFCQVCYSISCALNRLKSESGTRKRYLNLKFATKIPKADLNNLHNFLLKICFTK